MMIEIGDTIQYKYPETKTINGLIIGRLTPRMFKVYDTDREVRYLDERHFICHNVVVYHLRTNEINKSLSVSLPYDMIDHCILMYLVRTSRSYDLQILNKCIKLKPHTDLLTSWLETLIDKIAYYQNKRINNEI